MTNRWAQVRVPRLRGELDEAYELRRSEIAAIVTGFRKGTFDEALAAILDDRLDLLHSGEAKDAGEDPYGVREIVEKGLVAPVPDSLVAERRAATAEREPKGRPGSGGKRDSNTPANLVAIPPRHRRLPEVAPAFARRLQVNRGGVGVALASLRSDG